MKLEIKLKDPKYCDECPCKNEDYENGSKCNLDYWRSDGKDIFNNQGI